MCRKSVGCYLGRANIWLFRSVLAQVFFLQILIDVNFAYFCLLMSFSWSLVSFCPISFSDINRNYVQIMPITKHPSDLSILPDGDNILANCCILGQHLGSKNGSHLYQFLVNSASQARASQVFVQKVRTAVWRCRLSDGHKFLNLQCLHV